MSMFFSDSKGHAFLTYIIKCFQEFFDNKTDMGRTHIQKIPYMLKAVGIPINFSYQLHFYGPYSENLAFAIDDLLADDIIIDSSNNPRCSNFKLSKESETLLSKYDGDIEPYKERINNIFKIFNSFTTFSTNDLEAITTLYYAYLEQIAANKVPNKNELIESFIKIKKNKFSNDFISNMIDKLVEIEFFSIST